MTTTDDTRIEAVLMIIPFSTIFTVLALLLVAAGIIVAIRVRATMRKEAAELEAASHYPLDDTLSAHAESGVRPWIRSSTGHFPQRH